MTKRQRRLEEYLSPKHEEAPKGLWSVRNSSVLYYESHPNHLALFDSKSAVAVAAFDLDGTLIIPASGRRFPRDGNDWRYLFKVVPDKLKTLSMQGFAIIIFTNQLGVGLDITESRKRDFQRKIEALSSHIKIPFTLFAALGEDSYRKPNVGMWNLLLEHLPKNIDLKESFFVGDAAGRLKGWKRGKTADHSNADKVFACNIGITFHTPEEFFNGEL